MAKLEIRVDVIGNQTVSRYEMHKNDWITFHNAHSSGVLVIRSKEPGVNGPPPALCMADKKTRPPKIEIQPMGTDAYRICKDANLDQFAYEAQIGSFTAEDPIVIIEQYSNPIVIIEYAPIVGALLIGLAAGYWIAKRRGNRTIARN